MPNSAWHNYPVINLFTVYAWGLTHNNRDWTDRNSLHCVNSVLASSVLCGLSFEQLVKTFITSSLPDSVDLLQRRETIVIALHIVLSHTDQRMSECCSMLTVVQHSIPLCPTISSSSSTSPPLTGFWTFILLVQGLVGVDVWWYVHCC